MKMRWIRTLPVFLVCFLAALPAAADVSFVREIAPILLKRCTGCHGERANLGGYRTHTYQNLMRMGASGQAVVVPGKPNASRLFRLITAQAEAVRMPRSDEPLSAVQIELLRKWILEGAKFDGSDPTTPLKSLSGPRVHPAAPAVYRVPVPVLALAFKPGGQELAVGGYHEVTLWNPATGALLRRLQHLPQRIQALAFSRDGKQLLVGGGTPGEYGEVALVDPATGERTKVLDTFSDIVLSAAFSPDGKRIVAGGADAGVRAYETESGKRLWVSNIHADWVTSVCFSSDGKFVASASRDMTVKIHEAQDGALFTTYNGHNRQIGAHRGAAPVYAVRFDPASDLAYSAGGGKWIQVWDPIKAKAESGDAGDMEERFAKDGHARYIAHGFQQDVYALAVRDGQLFAASADGALKQFDLSTLQPVRTYSGYRDWVFTLDYDAASHRVAGGSYGGEVRVWDTQTGRPLAAFQAQPGALSNPIGTL
ncbi:MAG TPA: c-type cytochrome domain-containing protein [Chthonomonadaceae bacterium]|nr:c-type cytochrome domain-containing protein [Chthonomonadaceae bacterium]